MVTYKDIGYYKNTYIEFFKLDGKWYLAVFDPDCDCGKTPELELSEKYTDEDIQRIKEKYLKNAGLIKNENYLGEVFYD